MSSRSLSSRHSHASHGHNLNHLHSYKAPDKGLRYINRPMLRSAIPMTFTNRSSIIPFITKRPHIPTMSNNIIYAPARSLTTRPPVHGLSSDGPYKSFNQLDNEGWVDPEDMPGMSSIYTSANDSNLQPSENPRHKNKAGTASQFPTDAEASLSADKQDLTPQEMTSQSPRPRTRQRKFNKIAEEEQPIRGMDDSDIASHSTQGHVADHEKQNMSANQTDGKMNTNISSPPSYGSNPPEGNDKPETKARKATNKDEWSA